MSVNNMVIEALMNAPERLRTAVEEAICALDDSALNCLADTIEMRILL